MAAEKKPNASEVTEIRPVTEIIRAKKTRREQLLRAIRAKSYSETVRAVIRQEISKKEDSSAA